MWRNSIFVLRINGCVLCRVLAQFNKYFYPYRPIYFPLSSWLLIRLLWSDCLPVCIRGIFFILILRGSCSRFVVHESPTGRSPPLIPVTLAHFSLPLCRYCCWEIFVLLGYWAPSLGVYSLRSETSVNQNPENETTAQVRKCYKTHTERCSAVPNKSKDSELCGFQNQKTCVTGLWSRSSKLVWMTGNICIYCYSVNCGLE